MKFDLDVILLGALAILGILAFVVTFTVINDGVSKQHALKESLLECLQKKELDEVRCILCN